MSNRPKIERHRSIPTAIAGMTPALALDSDLGAHRNLTGDTIRGGSETQEFRLEQGVSPFDPCAT
jgi:hypothetical protein